MDLNQGFESVPWFEFIRSKKAFFDKEIYIK